MSKTCSPPKRFPLAAVLLGAAGVLYPLLVYIGRAAVPPLAFVGVALALIALRLAVSRGSLARPWRAPLAGAAVAIAVLAPLDAQLAAKAYPVVLSLGVAALFGASLVRPPSLIERFARLTEPDLPPAGQAYCRKVTMAWTVWLLANAAVAAALALWGSEAAWALWTGLIAYLVMALLIGGEVLVRRRVRGRAGA